MKRKQLKPKYADKAQRLNLAMLDGLSSFVAESAGFVNQLADRLNGDLDERQETLNEIIAEAELIRHIAEEALSYAKKCK
jgi:hypothetical protein